MKNKIFYFTQKRTIRTYILNNSINSSHLAEHLAHYKHVMQELRGVSVNKDIGLVHTLHKVGDEPILSDILTAVNVKTANTESFANYLLNINHLLDIRHKIGALYHENAAMVYNSNFIKNNEWVINYKQGIPYNP